MPPNCDDRRLNCVQLPLGPTLLPLSGPPARGKAGALLVLSRGATLVLRLEGAEGQVPAPEPQGVRTACVLLAGLARPGLPRRLLLLLPMLERVWGTLLRWLVSCGGGPPAPRAAPV